MSAAQKIYHKGHDLEYHPTVKPVDLMEWLCNLVKPPKDGIVLDPFSGTGSTLLAARKTNQAYVGIEISDKYCAIAKAKLEHGT